MSMQEAVFPQSWEYANMESSVFCWHKEILFDMELETDGKKYLLLEMAVYNEPSIVNTKRLVLIKEDYILPNARDMLIYACAFLFTFNARTLAQVFCRGGFLIHTL